MQIIYEDADVLVCVKPARVLSTDEPGGLPELIRQERNMPHMDLRTVHRLDRVVSGLMVLAKNAASASGLSKQIREDVFQKEYLAVAHGRPEAQEGVLKDLLFRDKARKMTMVATEPGKGVQEAELSYVVEATAGDLTKVRICLKTGRTHQIRVQFASRGMPLVGERKYATLEEDCDIALWSCGLGFYHPVTNQWMAFRLEPPAQEPWTFFSSV